MSTTQIIPAPGVLSVDGPASFESVAFNVQGVLSVSASFTTDAATGTVQFEFTGDDAARYNRVAPDPAQAVVNGANVVTAQNIARSLYVRLRILGVSAASVTVGAITLTFVRETQPVSGSLNVAPLPQFQDSSKGVFGDSISSPLETEVHVNFAYNSARNQEIRFVTAADTGNEPTTAVANQMLAITTDADGPSYIDAETVRSITYKSGVGIMGRFGARFTAPGFANVTQWVGIGDAFTGAFVGVTGAGAATAAFGIMLRRGGTPDVISLTVTGAVTVAGNINVALNGATAKVIAIQVGSTASVAAQIANPANNWQSYASSNGLEQGWDVMAIGSVVYFTARTPGLRNGVNSTANLTTTGYAGTTAVVVTGVVPTETITLAPSFNIDRLDGTYTVPDPNLAGFTSFTISNTILSNGNVFQIRFQYLGFGKLQFAMEYPDGVIRVFHQILFSGTSTTTHVDHPNLPLAIEAHATAATTSVTVQTTSMCAMSEGNALSLDPRFSFSTSFQYKSADLERNAFALGVRYVMPLADSLACRGVLRLAQLAVTGNSASMGTINLYYMNSTVPSRIPTSTKLLGTATDYHSWTLVNNTESVAMTSTTSLTQSGGIKIATLFVTGTAGTVFDLKPYNIQINKHQFLLVTIQGLSNNSNFGCAVNWIEDA